MTWTDLENIMPSERTQTQKTIRCTVRFYLCEKSRMGKSKEPESGLVVVRVEGRLVTFGGDEDILKSTVVMDAHLWECTTDMEPHALNGWIFCSANYMSIKLLKNKHLPCLSSALWREPGSLPAPHSDASELDELQ